MVQVVIFAPPGEDVSAGALALKSAGHQVEVVEATAANLLHMAIGMIDSDEEEVPAEEKDVEAEPKEPAEDELAAEEPTTESIGNVYVDGELVPAYLDAATAFPLLRVLDITGEAKLTYKINESIFSFWKSAGTDVALHVEGSQPLDKRVSVGLTASKPHIVLDKATAKYLGLV